MTQITRLLAPPAANRPRFVATMLALGVGLSMVLFVDVRLGLAAFALLLAFVVRPLDPLMALLVAVASASFVQNETGRLATQLSALALLCFWALLCLGVSARSGSWRLPHSWLTLALPIFLGTTGLSALHGIWDQQSPRYIGLELFPILALGTGLAVGGLWLSRRDARLVLVFLLILGVAHSGLGLFAYWAGGARRGGVFFTPVTGMLALLTLSFALREPRRCARLLLLLLCALFLLHQLLSFTRGYWMGLLAGLPVTVLLFTRRGPGVGRRWRTVGATAAAVAVLVVLGVVGVSFWLGWGNAFGMMGARFASSLSTQQSSDAASNIARLVEYWTALQQIAAAPWFGHGLGFTLHVRMPFYLATSTQWFVHHVYLWIWLKEGLVGLAALLFVLFAGFRIGLRASREHDPLTSAWGSCAAASTGYIAVLGLTNFPLAQVNSPFLLALLWGMAISFTRSQEGRVVWRVVAPVTPLGST